MRETKSIRPRAYYRGVDENGKETFTYRCPHCGMTLAISEDYCQGCGSRIDWEEDQ